MIKKINNFEVKSSGSISSGQPTEAVFQVGAGGGGYNCISCWLAAEHGNVGVSHVGFKIHDGTGKIS